MGCGASTQKKYQADKAATAEQAPAAAAAQPAATATAPAAAAPQAAPEIGALAPAAEAAPAVEAVPAEEAPAAPATLAPAAKAAPAEAKAEPVEKVKKDEDDEEEDEEEDVMDDAEFQKRLEKAQKKGARGCVSAECYEADANWAPPVFEKSPEQEARLRIALGKCFMFSVLDEEQLKVVIKAFQEIPAAAGQTLITQGDQVGSSEPALFVIESGRLDVFKRGIEKPVFTYTVPGQYFGDLALLYTCPRAATVVADTDSTLWSIDRDTFNNLVKDAARQQMQKRLGFLGSVPCLAGLNDGERMSMCDAMQVRTFQVGDYIIKKGDLGTDFFIVEQGTLEARIEGVPVMSYGAADFFGELALIRMGPRAADVVALETCRLLVLGAEVLKLVVGPLDQILKERAAAYANVNLSKLASTPTAS